MSLIIVLLTIGVSVYAFYNRKFFEKLSLKPNLVYHYKQYYRIFTHALIHADWVHLLVNMYVLYIFGGVCEGYFGVLFGGKARLLFLLLYVVSIIVSSLYTVCKYKNNAYYSAIGASGAVNAVVFATIFFDPWSKLYFFGLVPIPGIVFGALYLGYSYYMGKKNVDNIGHDAHFTGAIFGLLFPILMRPSLIQLFIEKLFHP